MSERPLTDAVLAFFQGDGWDVAEQQGGALLTRVRGEHVAFHCIIIPDEDRRRITAYALAPDPVPPAHLLAIVDFCTRANGGVAIGNFEVDVRSGELRFKAGVDLHDVEPQVALIRNLVYRTVFALDGTWPGLVAIIEGGSTVDEALALVGTLQAARGGTDDMES